MNRTAGPTAAGILNIIAGAVWLVGAVVVLLLLVGFFVGFGPLSGFQLVRVVFTLIGLAIPGVVAIVGGIFSLRRKGWGVALAGSICAVPLVLGIPSVVLTVVSRREFG